MAALHATERAVDAGEPPAPQPKKRVRRRLPIGFVVTRPFRALAFAFRTINEPVKRFSSKHGIARRITAFFGRHKIVTAIVEAAIVLVWLLPVVAFAVHSRHALFPGADIAKDVRGAWLLVVCTAAALAMGLLGNGPGADYAVAPDEDVDLGDVVVLVGFMLGPPIVLALWAYGAL